jgi:hypothetical protein
MSIIKAFTQKSRHFSGKCLSAGSLSEKSAVPFGEYAQFAAAGLWKNAS